MGLGVIFVQSGEWSVPSGPCWKGRFFRHFVDCGEFLPNVNGLILGFFLDAKTSQRRFLERCGGFHADFWRDYYVTWLLLRRFLHSFPTAHARSLFLLGECRAIGQVENLE
jgi:hypothetical protein